MADGPNQIPDVPNFADAQIIRDQIQRDQRHPDAHQAPEVIPEAAGGAGVPQGAVREVGARQGAGGENVAENPRGDLDMARWMKAQMELQMDAFLKAIARLTANQGAAAAAEGPAAPAAAQGVQMAQNTQELSLTTPVLFYGRCKDGKSIPPNTFLMELEERQTSHGWEPSMLLRFVKSYLRGEAALWWEGCILSYGDDQDQGPAENYAAFKTVFKQHYRIGGATNNLCWANTFCQRSDKDIGEYFSRATVELGNHFKESALLLYGKAYRPVDISGNVKVTLARLRARQDRVLDLDVAFLRDELESCSRYVTAQATKEAMFELERYRKNYHTFLTSQAIMQGIEKDSARSYAAEQVDKREETQ
jgi:hypothetical protein